jgi:hypothetical protein
MKKQSLQLLVLAGVFAVMLFLAIEQARPRAVTTPARPTLTPDARTANRVFEGWKTSDIVALRLDDTKTTIDLTLTFTSKGWELEGVEEGVDQDIAAQIVATFALMPYVERLPADQDLTRFSLTEEGIWMQAQAILADGSQHVIAVGGRSSVPAGWYALVDESPEVFILNKGAVDFLAIYLQEVQTIRTAP